MSETQQISHRNRVKRVGDTAIKWLNVHTMCWIGQSLNKLISERKSCIVKIYCTRYLCLDQQSLIDKVICLSNKLGRK